MCYKSPGGVSPPCSSPDNWLKPGLRALCFHTGDINSSRHNGALLSLSNLLSSAAKEAADNASHLDGVFFNPSI